MMRIGLVSISKTPFLGERQTYMEALFDALNLSSLEIAYCVELKSKDLCQPLKLHEVDRLIVVADQEDLGNFIQLVGIHKDKIIAVEPSLNGVKFFVYEILPALDSAKFAQKHFKTLGADADKITALIAEIPLDKIQILLKPSFLECDIIIKYPIDMLQTDIDIVADKIKNNLKDYIYAEQDKTLAEVALELLTQNNKKLAIAESFTGGNITAALVGISGASKVLIEGLTTYSNMSKIHRLDVDQLFLEKEGAVSQEIVYQMAAGLLSSSGADYVIATTGYADPSDGEQAGLCYIAIGEKRGIHIYRHKFTGSRAEVIQSGVKTALFRLIALLKRA